MCYFLVILENKIKCEVAHWHAPCMWWIAMAYMAHVYVVDSYGILACTVYVVDSYGIYGTCCVCGG